MGVEQNLFKTSKDEYGDSYGADLLEQYKLFVESADRISQCRQTANSFFLSINTALLAFLGVVVSRSSAGLPIQWFILIAVAGAVLCFAWYRLVRSYKGLNTGKFEIIHALEKRLPAAIYDAEWKELGEGKDPKKYKPFSEIELWIPWVFVALYVVSCAAAAWWRG